jgi:phosphomevalonate kinase
MLIIGISGKKRSGKDTVFEFAKKHITEGTVLKFAFADGVKEECSKAAGVTVEHMESHKDIFRKLYQFWGTEFRRGFYGNDYWVTYLRNKILSNAIIQKDESDNLGKGVIVFITDVRFKNEADWIKSVGGFVIRIDRKDNKFYKNPDNHQSEIELDEYDKFDWTIVNNHTLEVLEYATKIALNHIKKKLNSNHNIKLK